MEDILKIICERLFKMNTYYNKLIQKYGEKKFLILYTIIASIVLMLLTFSIITFILGETILINRIPISFLLFLVLGYFKGHNIIKKK